MRRTLAWLLALLWLPLAACAAEDNAAKEEYIEGINYELVSPPMPITAEQGVEVAEFFWYGCPHCFVFEPHIKRWKQESKPEAATFVQVPAIFNNPVWKLHAQAYYTADLLGVFDTLHPALFKALHEEKKKLATREALADFFAAHGVEQASFDRTFDSFAVIAKVNRAADLTQRSGIGGVPAIVVAGKYRVTGQLAGSYEAMLDIVNHLVRKEAGAAAAD